MTNCTNIQNKILSTVVVVIAIAGCASTGTNLLEGERIDYQSASKNKKGPNLEVPPDLSQISRDNRFAIPESGNNGPVTASGFAKSNAIAAITSAADSSKVALNFSQDMRIERDGTQRWLLVKQSPEVLWPKVKEFWQENGFLIDQESQTTGVMETDWAENRAKIPEDFIRSAIGFIFESLYSTGERDKFRTRLERRADGSTEIYISHRGLEEVLTGAQKSNATWVNRANDPALEATFLTRLMVYLGATQAKAKELVAAPAEKQARAKLVTADGITSVNVDEGFDRAWRRVGLALDRVGFTVEDRDRNKGIYFVRYIDEEGDTKQEGFFTRIFGTGDKNANAKRYRILVKGELNASHVTVENNDGAAENSVTSSKILALLLEQLK